VVLHGIVTFFVGFGAIQDSSGITHQHCLPFLIHRAQMCLSTCQLLRKPLTHFHMCFLLSSSPATKWPSWTCLDSFCASSYILVPLKEHPGLSGSTPWAELASEQIASRYSLQMPVCFLRQTRH